MAGLVGAELAFASVLLVGGGSWAARSCGCRACRSASTSQGLITADVVLPESRYGTRGAQTLAFTGIVDGARAIPGSRPPRYVITPPLSPRGGIGSPILFGEKPDQLPVEVAGRARAVRLRRLLRHPRSAPEARDAPSTITTGRTACRSRS